jgi:putative methionine-R-sulfoxide reductase with GAF domain
MILDVRRDADLVDALRAEARRNAPTEERAQRIAELLRLHTGRRSVGLYQIDGDEVVNLAWSGPAPPAYPRFPVSRGLTGAAIASGTSIVSNDVATDSRYLTALDSTGSELIVPIFQEGRVVGTLDVEDERTNAFAGADQMFFEEVASALGELYSL